MKLRTLSGTIPSLGVGQVLTFQFSPIERVKIESMVIQYTTGVSTGLRTPWLQLLDPNGVVTFATGDLVGVSASAEKDLVFSPVYGSPVQIQSNPNAGVGLPFPDFWLPPAWTIKVGASSFSAGDTIGPGTFAAHYSEDVWHKEQDQAAWAAAIAALAL